MADATAANAAGAILLMPPPASSARTPTLPTDGPPSDRLRGVSPVATSDLLGHETRWRAFVMGAVAAWVVPILGWISLLAVPGNAFVWWGIVVSGAVATDGYLAFALWPRIEAGKRGWHDVVGLLTFTRFISARACLLVILGLVAAIPELSSNPATVSSLSGVAPAIIARTAAASGVIMIPLLLPTAWSARDHHAGYHSISGGNGVSGNSALITFI